MLIAAAAPSSSFYLGPFHCHLCHAVPFSCSTSYGVPSSWIKPTCELQRVSDHSAVSFRCEDALFGATQFNWFPLRHDSSISRVSVAADYSDSVPDSSNYVANKGYHPLEELRECRRVRDKMLTSAEIARTAVEANNNALLIFPGIVHNEPHEHISWAEFQYVIDEFGDIFFEIYDGENILQDRGASNPVNVLIGMDLLQYENRKIDVFDDGSLETDTNDDILFDDDYFKVEYSETSDIQVDWGMPENSSWIHPVYFAKCLTKAVNVEHAEMMDCPTNGVSILGILKPAFIDEELYLRRLFSDEDSDGYTSDWKDGDSLSFSSRDDGSHDRSTIYKLEITKIELFSVYGVQSAVGVQDFQYAEPDVLVHSIPSILEQFGERGTRCNFALKALCKKKGLHVEVANLIGVDSLGMDVRVSSGTEVRTHRFPFKVRATSECAAEKQIQQLLFPRSRRKKLKTLDRSRDADSF
ncbi:Pentatricopeptide repeat (PPR) superfamily protein [Abeliophyllum distichum]|uniref:Pentatricopeptide repeat (PPR) superfamily protein n=1 Tax=Abeliophyllum distichum TaxID=126358 RepID=A0ABD1Q1X5_9LAMI